MREYGKSEYSKLVSDIRATKNQNIGLVADWAKRLKIDLLALQRILYAEEI
jgi:hypothetical protein